MRQRVWKYPVTLCFTRNPKTDFKNLLSFLYELVQSQRAMKYVPHRYGICSWYIRSPTDLKKVATRHRRLTKPVNSALLRRDVHNLRVCHQVLVKPSYCASCGFIPEISKHRIHITRSTVASSAHHKALPVCLIRQTTGPECTDTE